MFVYENLYRVLCAQAKKLILTFGRNLSETDLLRTYSSSLIVIAVYSPAGNAARYKG